MMSPADDDLARLRRDLGHEPAFDAQADIDDGCTPSDATNPGSNGLLEGDGGPPVSGAALDVADAILGSASRQAEQAPVRLVVCRDDERADLDDGAEIVIGRGVECFVPSTDGRVSRRHARISTNGARVTVTDLGSSNGTTVRRGGDHVVVGDLPVELRAGDELVTIDDVVLARIVDRLP